LGSLRIKVNDHVHQQLKDYGPLKVRGPKVIHDTILGTNQFHAHEIAVIDSPLIQRLRRISQVDVVSLVWPSGNHNRFEHSLGVAIIADKFIKALFNKTETRDKLQSIDSQESITHHVRMAGLLHDCGHGPFSHMSESIFKSLNDMRDEIDSDEKLATTDPNAHEALGYLIVTSEAFKDFFDRVITRMYEIDLDLDLIGEMIIGYISNPLKAFMVNIINGAFDADKLDYIQRDSHFTGIKMILDLDRLFYTLDLIDIENKLRNRLETRLTIDISGVTTLEEIVFDKMMLNTTVYNHHKVRAAEGLFKSIFEVISETKNGEFESAADFLRHTDDDVYGLSRMLEYNPEAAQFSKALLDRNLPKRALVISNKTVRDDTQSNLWKISRLHNNPDEVLAIRKKIAECAQREMSTITYKDIWFDVPKIPSYEEGDQWPIKSAGDPNGYLTLHEIFPVDQWVKAFSQNKWKAHIFTKPEYRDQVKRASIEVIKSEYDIDLNEYAEIYSKIG